MNSAKYVLTAAIGFLLAIALTEGGWMEAGAQTTEPSRFPSGIRGLADGQDEHNVTASLVRGAWARSIKPPIPS